MRHRIAKIKILQSKRRQNLIDEMKNFQHVKN